MVKRIFGNRIIQEEPKCVFSLAMCLKNPSTSRTGFFAGESVPVNKKLSEIFLQLHISEKSGRGVPKIIEKYGKEAFDLRQNSIVVTIPDKPNSSKQKYITIK